MIAKTKQSDLGLKNPRYSIGIEGGKILFNTAFHKNNIANAKELVRRWNAFEEGGIVNELRMACDEGLHECERVKINCTCEHKDLGGLLRRIVRIEAAIAKANPK